MFGIECRPSVQLSLKVEPVVAAEIDAAASRLDATRSSVARALLRAGLKKLGETGVTE